MEGTAPADLSGHPGEEPVLDVLAVVVLELLPAIRLRGEDEVQHVPREKAALSVVDFRGSLQVAAGLALAVGGAVFGDLETRVVTGVRTSVEQTTLDRFLEAGLRDLGGHRSARFVA